MTNNLTSTGSLCNNIFSMSSNSKLIQYKVLHIAHITHKLQCMGFSHTNASPRYPASTDNYFHSIWLCYYTQRFKILDLRIFIFMPDFISTSAKPEYVKAFILIVQTIAKNYLNGKTEPNYPWLDSMKNS